MDYPSLHITAAQEGALLDMRARLAIQLAASLGFAALVDRHVNDSADPAATYAKMALDTADEIVLQAEQRGWVTPLTRLDETLPPTDVQHVQRSSRASVIQQMHQQEVAQELMPRVGPVRGGFGIPPQ